MTIRKTEDELREDAIARLQNVIDEANALQAQYDAMKAKGLIAEPIAFMERDHAE